MDRINGIELDIAATEAFLPAAELDALAPRVAAAAADLEARRGPGSEFLGWLDLPADLAGDHLQGLENAAAQARQDSEVCVVIGIGGSYLGARAVIDALGGSTTGFPRERSKTFSSPNSFFNRMPSSNILRIQEDFSMTELIFLEIATIRLCAGLGK